VTALIVGGLIAVAAVVFVALPFLREDGEPELIDEAHAQVADRLALMEARDRALGALKELEFDHRTGKVDDDDYRTLVGPLRRTAADALQALAAHEEQVPPSTPQPRRAKLKRRA
jgi:hypothetical protein